MIANWKCLFVYFQYNFSSTYLFLFVSIKLITQMLNVLVISLCKSVIHKLKMLGWVKIEYYKSMRGNHKRGGANFEISVGGSNIGAHDFWLIFSGGKFLEETMDILIFRKQKTNWLWNMYYKIKLFSGTIPHGASDEPRAYFKPSQTSMREHFANNYWLQDVNYFHKKAASQVFDLVLNMPQWT